MLATDVSNMHRLEIREHRFRLQQRIGKLEDGPEKEALEAEVAAIQEACPHVSDEEGAKGWRCRDCDMSREPEPEPEEEEAAGEPAAAETTPAPAAD
ncbi:MAG: hypothetical protein GKS06_05670 [Acidobacteria bacterium]|nr:hypothetical protein [Acidobacteriota bacterium]